MTGYNPVKTGTCQCGSNRKGTSTSPRKLNLRNSQLTREAILTWEMNLFWKGTICNQFQQWGKELSTEPPKGERETGPLTGESMPDGRESASMLFPNPQAKSGDSCPSDNPRGFRRT